MDSGRLLLAVILMIALVVITNILLPTGPRPQVVVPADTAVTPARAPDTIEAVPRAALPPAQQVAVEADSGALAADTIAIESGLYRYAFSTRGASIISAELKPFESATRPGPVELKPDESRTLIAYRLKIGNVYLDLDRLEFTVDSSSEAGVRTVRFVHTPDSITGLGIELDYTLDPQNYVLDVHARVTGAPERPQLLIDFAPALRINEAKASDDEAALAYVYNNSNTGIGMMPLRNVETERIENGPLIWAALKNKYFLTAALQADSAPMPFGGLIARPTGQPNSANLTVTLLAGTDGELAFRLYVGPQEPQRLIALGHDLRDVSPFGWRALQPILRPIGHGITWALVTMHDALNISYGLVLVLFGILVRIVLWPLNAKAMRSQLKNMEMQPRLKEIQTKYKADPERLQKEMLRLYKEEGFNPMGGCLPILIPFPILIALFFVFQSTIVFRGVSFLWLPDLSRADPFYILPVMLGVSMFLLQWLSMRSTKDANPQMKFMMYFMPIFMTVLFLNFPSGLNLYYASMNLASVPQQIQIMNERKKWQASRQPPAPEVTRRAHRRA
jgi:YidC/Oxa1 family membrane protein insertase